MAEKQKENRGLSISPAIKRSETSNNDRETGKTFENQNINIQMGDNRGIRIYLRQIRFKGRVEEVGIFLYDGFKLASDLFEFMIMVRRNDTYGAVCHHGSETSGKFQMSKWSYWLAGSESEVYDYYCYDQKEQGCLVLQKETRNMTFFVDTVVAIHYVVVDKVATFVVTMKIKTNGGTGLSVEVEDPVRQPCDFAKEKLLCFVDENTAAMKSGGALISRGLNSENNPCFLTELRLVVIATPASISVMVEV